MTTLNAIATFSIVAADPPRQELGVVVQSKFLAVGAVVPFARAGVGAVATQSYANTSYGPRGLALLASGLHPDAVIQQLIAEDEDPSPRQVGLVDAQGRAAAYTGPGCHVWAGHRVGPGYAAQGNILVSQETVDALADTFEGTSGSLAERLLAALAAGQRAGGDRRGRQSASLLVVKPQGGYGGWNDRWLDLRVDDHPTPIAELKRLYDLHQIYMGEPRPEDLVSLDADLVGELQERLATRGYYQGSVNGQWNEATAQALDDWAGVENLEERLREDGTLDLAVLRFLRQQTRLQNKGGLAE